MEAGNSAPSPANAAVTEAAAVSSPVSARAAGRGVPYRCSASSGMYLRSPFAVGLSSKRLVLGSHEHHLDQGPVSWKPCRRCQCDPKCAARLCARLTNHPVEHGEV